MQPTTTVMREFAQSCRIVMNPDEIVIKGSLELQTAFNKYSNSLVNTDRTSLTFYRNGKQSWEKLIKEVSAGISRLTGSNLYFNVVERNGFNEKYLSERITIETNWGHSFQCEGCINYTTGLLEIYIYEETIKSSHIVKVSKLICYQTINLLQDRPKDIYDLFLLTKLTNYKMSSIIDSIVPKIGRSKGLMLPPIHMNYDIARVLYEEEYKDKNVPSFDEVYKSILDFIYPMLDQAFDNYELFWNSSKGIWVTNFAKEVSI